MKTVSELDQNDTDVPRHCQRHFLKVFSLLLFRTVKIDLGELTHTIDKICDFLAKLSTNILFSHTCVFDDVVEKSRHDALVVHVHARKHSGYRQRVRDVGFSSPSRLAVVRLFGIEKRPFYFGNELRRQVSA